MFDGCGLYNRFCPCLTVTDLFLTEARHYLDELTELIFLHSPCNISRAEFGAYEFIGVRFVSAVQFQLPERRTTIVVDGAHTRGLMTYSTDACLG